MAHDERLAIAVERYLLHESIVTIRQIVRFYDVGEPPAGSEVVDVDGTADACAWIQRCTAIVLPSWPMAGGLRVAARFDAWPSDDLTTTLP